MLDFWETAKCLLCYETATAWYDSRGRQEACTIRQCDARMSTTSRVCAEVAPRYAFAEPSADEAPFPVSMI